MLLLCGGEAGARGGAAACCRARRARLASSWSELLRPLVRSPLHGGGTRLFRAEHVLPAAERRLTVTPPSAKKRRKRAFCLVFDRFSGQDTKTKSAQTLEKTTYPALNSGLAERVRQDSGRPEKGPFRCRTYGTARTSSAVGGLFGQIFAIGSLWYTMVYSFT